MDTIAILHFTIQIGKFGGLETQILPYIASSFPSLFTKFLTIFSLLWLWCFIDQSAFWTSWLKIHGRADSSRRSYYKIDSFAVSFSLIRASWSTRSLLFSTLLIKLYFYFTTIFVTLIFPLLNLFSSTKDPHWIHIIIILIVRKDSQKNHLFFSINLVVTFQINYFIR